MIDRQRFASVFGISVLILSLVAFGIPAPTIVQDGTPEASESVDGIHPSYDIHMTTTEGVLTQDARALCGTGVCVAGIIALSAGAAGTALGAHYFNGGDTSPDGESGAYYMLQNLQNRASSDITTVNNSLEETRTMAYRVAETSFAEKMAENATKTDAQQYADQEVTDYLEKTIRDELVRRNNEYMATLEASANISGVSKDQYINSFERTNISAWSGKAEFNVSYIDRGSSNEPYSWVYFEPSQDYDMDFTYSFSSSDYGDVTVTVPRQGYQTYDDYVAIRGEVINELDSFASSINESQYDNLSADEIISPVNQALEWGQNYNQTGSSGYASALASSLGYAVNGTGTMYHVKMPVGTSTWYNGTVYADESTIPNGTIQANTTYSGSNTTAYVATSSGTTTLDEDWKVVKITNSDGETLNQTVLNTWSRSSLNSTSPLETLREWQALQEEVGSGDGLFGGFLGGDGFLPFIPGGNAVHLLILAGGAFLLFGGSRGGGGTIVMGGGGSSGGQ